MGPYTVPPFYITNKKKMAIFFQREKERRMTVEERSRVEESYREI